MEIKCTISSRQHPVVGLLSLDFVCDKGLPIGRLLVAADQLDSFLQGNPIFDLITPEAYLAFHPPTALGLPADKKNFLFPSKFKDS